MLNPFGSPDVHPRGRVLSYKTLFTWLEIGLYLFIRPG